MREAKFTSPLTVAFSKETYQKIKAVSDKEKISMAELVRNITDKALKDVDGVEQQ